MVRSGVAWGFAGVLILAAAGAAPLKPWAAPKDRAGWEARRPEVRAAVRRAVGWEELPPVTVSWQPAEGRRDGVREWRGAVEGPSGKEVRLACFRPEGGAKVAGVLLLAGEDFRAPAAPEGSGLDGTVESYARELASRGVAVVLPERDGTPATEWLTREGAWKARLAQDRAALAALFGRDDVDPKRVGVAGIGDSGMRAWWLMALDERVACGAAAGGMTRLSDWRAAGEGRSLAGWAEGLLGTCDAEGVMALCAPRHLQVFGGDRDPFAPAAGYKVLRDAARKVYGFYPRGKGISYTTYGDDDGAFSLLEWDSMHETFEKAFQPQGPTALGHAAEAEPAVDGSWVDPAGQGIAGWFVEMSQRPGTWSWQDGVIACRPGKSEYGWLRMPIELGDFVLRLEWRVPKGGNSGIFLRAKPVPWTFPPGDKSKDRVSTLALDWPSRTGLELQAQDDPGVADRYSSGSLYRHAAPASNPTKTAGGEWNRYTVRCRGMRVEVWSNGVQVLDTTLDRYPTLRTPPLKGYIGLQNHGVSAEFRNLRFLKLTPEAGTPEPGRAGAR